MVTKSNQTDSSLPGLITSKDLSSLPNPIPLNRSDDPSSSSSSGPSTTSNLDLKTRIRILEEGFWDSLTIPKGNESSGSSIDEKLSNLFFRHLDLDQIEDQKEEEDFTKRSEKKERNEKNENEKENDDYSNKKSKNEIKSKSTSKSTSTSKSIKDRVSPYLSQNCQLLFPGGVRIENKSQALEIFEKSNPWSKFFILDMRIEIIPSQARGLFDGREMKTSNMRVKERKRQEEVEIEIEVEEKEEEKEKEGEGERENEIEKSQIAMVTYKIKARTEDFFYEALCFSAWGWDSTMRNEVDEDERKDEDEDEDGEGSWKLIVHQQTPVK